MPISSAGFIWAIAAFTFILIMLACSTVAVIVIHNKKIGEAGRRFRMLFEKAFEAKFLIDEKCLIVDANESSTKMLGCSKKEFMGKEFVEFMTRDEWPKFQIECKKSLLSGMDYFSETKLVAKDGSIIAAEVGAIGLKINGGNYLLASFRDIGAHKQTQEELTRKNATLQEIMTHLADEKMKYKKEVAEVVVEVLLPALNKLENNDGTLSKTHRDVLRDSLQELANESGGILYSYGKLTPREVEIANMLKSGASSKDIADTLKISILTVNKHRERIRRKLVITKKSVNLYTFLNNPQQ